MADIHRISQTTYYLVSGTEGMDVITEENVDRLYADMQVTRTKHALTGATDGLTFKGLGDMLHLTEADMDELLTIMSGWYE